MSSRPTLQALRSMIGRAESRSAREALPFSRLSSSGGIPKGAITEISGPSGGGKTAFVLHFLSEYPDLRVAWIEKNLTVYPYVFPRWGVDLQRVLFIEAGAQTAWAALQSLHSGVFQVIVLSFPEVSGKERTAGNKKAGSFSLSTFEMTLRRLQLAAEKSGTALVLLTETPMEQGSWPIATRLEIGRGEVRLWKGHSSA